MKQLILPLGYHKFILKFDLQAKIGLLETLDIGPNVMSAPQPTVQMGLFLLKINEQLNFLYL